MAHWIATTASGTTYEQDGGRVRIVSDRDTQVFTVYDMRVSTGVAEEGKGYRLPWANPIGWLRANRPEIGKHLYVSGKDEWRASTPVVSIVDIEEAE